MAPEIALDECAKLPANSIVLDPMCGSGTTLRAAIEHGIKAIGSDLDPMAVLIASVNTTPIDVEEAIKASIKVVEDAKNLAVEDTYLPWIDNDPETQKFIKFWFAEKQIDELRRLMMVISCDYGGSLQDFLKIAVSRLIITKEKGASLARDTSHSRPHRVALTNDYEVFPNFLKSAKLVASKLPQTSNKLAKVSRADARFLDLPDAQVDMVITSPPYLNAIDYMRGHKLALVWLGHSLSSLRVIRSTSIGAERRPDIVVPEEKMRDLTQKMKFYQDLGSKEKGMFDRYVLDMVSLMKEIARVLKPQGRALLVVGNSCLKGVFIKNTMAVTAAAEIVGLKFVSEDVRDLPANSRYLPPPSAANTSTLTNRMRTESLLAFSKV
jgi:DNA modification methylase